MEIAKVTSLEKCLEQIENMEKLCETRFTPRACINIKNYYRDYCYKMFEKTTTSSSDNIFGGNTLNLSNKSPPPSL
jgi:hypothetical protein